MIRQNGRDMRYGNHKKTYDQLNNLKKGRGKNEL